MTHSTDVWGAPPPGPWPGADDGVEATPASPYAAHGAPPPTGGGVAPGGDGSGGQRSARSLAGLAALVLLAGAAGGGVVAVLDRTGSSAAVPAAPASVVRSDTGIGASSGGPAGSAISAAAVIGPSVVTVEVSGSQAVAGNPFFGQPAQTQPVSDTGSGIVVRTAGSSAFVLTNNHVVAAAESGGTVHVTLTDGRTVPATIVGHDATDDLAVIRITGVSGLKPAVFANSDHLVIGQPVLAVGAPLGLSNTVTEGIVSTVHRPVATGEAGAGAQAVIDAVQTDAAINPGNSGGALVDLAGRVVGINSAIASTGSAGTGQAGNIGVGFAIPSNDAADVADQLIATGHAVHAQMGVSVRDATSSTDGAPGLGADITQVVPGGPAAHAGLQPGDLVTQVGSRAVTDADSLIVAIRSNRPGSQVAVTYSRAGRVGQATVTLAGASSD